MWPRWSKPNCIFPWYAPRRRLAQAVLFSIAPSSIPTGIASQTMPYPIPVLEWLPKPIRSCSLHKTAVSLAPTLANGQSCGIAAAIPQTGINRWCKSLECSVVTDAWAIPSKFAFIFRLTRRYNLTYLYYVRQTTQNAPCQDVRTGARVSLQAGSMCSSARPDPGNLVNTQAGLRQASV